MSHEIIEMPYENAMNSYSAEIAIIPIKKKSLIVTKSFIPINYNQSKVVYFVDDSDGNSYDSFADKHEAIKYARTFQEVI